MIYQDLVNYISERYQVVNETGDTIVFYYSTNNGSKIGMCCSVQKDEFCEWLVVSALVCALTTSDLQKIVSFHGSMLRPSGGVDIMNGQIWVRQAFPFASVIMPSESGAAYENSIRQILYNLSSRAYVPSE